MLLEAPAVAQEAVAGQPSWVQAQRGLHGTEVGVQADKMMLWLSLHWCCFWRGRCFKAGAAKLMLYSCWADRQRVLVHLGPLTAAESRNKELSGLGRNWIHAEM